VAQLSRCTPRQAAAEIALATKLSALPEIAAAFADGRISSAQLVAAATIATPETQYETILFAQSATPTELERRAAIRRGELAEQRQEAHRKRHLGFRHDGDAAMRFFGSLPFLEGQQLEQQLRKIADRLELGSENRSAPSTRMADALLILTNGNASAALAQHEATTSAETKTGSPAASTNQRTTSTAETSNAASTEATETKTATSTASASSAPPASNGERARKRFDKVGGATSVSRAIIDFDEDPFPDRSDSAEMDEEPYGYGLFEDPPPEKDQRQPIVNKADTRIIIHWNAASGVVNYENGPPIDHPRLAALLCDARLDIEHVDGNGLPIGLQTSARHANWRQDRYLAFRDGPCRVPGCPCIGKTHAHHLFEDQSDRVSDVRAMINICNFDHGQHHDGNLAITGDPEGIITFTYPDGRQVHSPARSHDLTRPNPTPFNNQRQPSEQHNRDLAS
jgi:hypothetical protein